MRAPAHETSLERRLRVQREVQEKAAQYRLYLRTSAAGLEFGLSIVVGVLIGYGADRYLGSAPWGLLLGLAAGLAAGIRGLYRMVQQNLASDDDVAAAEDEAAASERRDVRLG